MAGAQNQRSGCANRSLTGERVLARGGPSARCGAPNRAFGRILLPAPDRDDPGTLLAALQIRSMMIAGAMPPAAHMVTRP